MCDETTAHIRTHVASARANCKEIDILHVSCGCLQTVSESPDNLFSWTRADSADSADQSFPRDSEHLPDKNDDNQYRYSEKSSECAHSDSPQHERVAPG